MNNEQIELVLTQYLKDLKKTSSEKEMSEIIEIMTIFLTETNKKQLEESISKLQQLSKSDGPCRAASIWLLGFCNLEGYIVSKNLELAIQFFEQAAKENFAPAINHLGYCYKVGEGVEQDTKRAIELYSKASELNFTIAHSNLGNYYRDRSDVEEDQKLAFDYFSRAAKEEFAPAIYHLGILYKDGSRGTDRDYKKAFEIFSLLEKEHYPGVTYELACCYRYGLGTAINFEEAVKLFKTLEEKNHRDATYELGLCYRMIAGYENTIEVIRYFEKASNLGSTRAQMELGELFLNGKGYIDIKKAIEYFQLAFENGNRWAGYYLIDIYRNSGYGVQDFFLVLKYSLEILKDKIISAYRWARPNRMKEVKEIMELNDTKKILDLYNPNFHGGSDSPSGEISQINSLKHLWAPSKTELFFEGYDLSGGYSIFTNELKYILREYEGNENSDKDGNKDEQNDEKKEGPKPN